MGYLDNYQITYVESDITRGLPVCVHPHLITSLASLHPWPNRIFSLMPIRLVSRSSLVLELDAK